MRRNFWIGILSLVTLFLIPHSVHAYIDAPPATLGMMCHWSTHIIEVQLEKVDREKGIVVWRKMRDVKGKWPGDELIRQVLNIPPDEKAHVLQRAEVGKKTVIFALESYKWCHTYIDGLWYASNTGDWQFWNACRVESLVLRTYSGRSEKLQSAASTIIAGGEVIVTCMADTDPAELQRRKAKIQRLRASLKFLDYNSKRDFVGWGSDDFEPLVGMPGFGHSLTLNRVGLEAQAISVTDFDGDGKLDLTMIGANRTALFQNVGDSMSEVTSPELVGARAAVWADYDGDGKVDLLLATPRGPKLLTNLGNGQFRDDTALLPRDVGYNLTSAAWIDYDNDGRSDILLGNGHHGLRLYRNGGDSLKGWLFSDVSRLIDRVTGKGDTLTIADVNNDGRMDVLYGVGQGTILLNMPTGFVELRDSGLVFNAGRTSPVFGDTDDQGRTLVFVPQLDGKCKLFRNDGTGKFTDITGGDLSKPIGMVTCAAWGDLDGDGVSELVVGCLRSPNRVFRNRGDGNFVDASDEWGMGKKIYNTQAVAICDLNRDGLPDIVLNNEGQDAMVLLADPERERTRTPVCLRAEGGRLRIVDAEGKFIAARDIGGTHGRGGQSAPESLFALAPGSYRVEVRLPSGVSRTRELMVGNTAMREVLK